MYVVKATCHSLVIMVTRSTVVRYCFWSDFRIANDFHLILHFVLMCVRANKFVLIKLIL